MTEKSPRHLVTLVVLLILTGATTLSVATGQRAWLIVAVFVLALAKLLLVAFRFMELRHAHLFWKTSFVVINVALLTTLTLLGSR
jgi:hypothetical protein